MARQTDHQRAEDLISAYIDGQVTAEEKQFFERHLAACADCRAQLEATRSMVAALKAMPTLKAPRSFVLPREMAKQPKRSILAWYPALRLATALAAMAFVVLFAGDMLLSRSGSNSAALSVPMAAPAPQMSPGNSAAPAPAATQVALAAPTATAAPAAGAAASNATAPGAGAVVEPSVAAPPVAAPPAAMKMATLATETITAADTTSVTVLAAPAPTLELAAVPPSATPEPTGAVEPSAAPEAAQRVVTPTPLSSSPAIDPLRVIEIALLALIVVLGIATFIARRKQI